MKFWEKTKRKIVLPIFLVVALLPSSFFGFSFNSPLENKAEISFQGDFDNYVGNNSLNSGSEKENLFNVAPRIGFNGNFNVYKGRESIAGLNKKVLKSEIKGKIQSESIFRAPITLVKYWFCEDETKKNPSKEDCKRLGIDYDGLRERIEFDSTYLEGLKARDVLVQGKFNSVNLEAKIGIPLNGYDINASAGWKIGNVSHTKVYPVEYFLTGFGPFISVKDKKTDDVEFFSLSVGAGLSFGYESNELKINLNPNIVFNVLMSEEYENSSLRLFLPEFLERPDYQREHVGDATSYVINNGLWVLDCTGKIIGQSQKIAGLDAGVTYGRFNASFSGGIGLGETHTENNFKEKERNENINRRVYYVSSSLGAELGKNKKWTITVSGNYERNILFDNWGGSISVSRPVNLSFEKNFLEKERERQIKEEEKFYGD